MPLPMVHLSVAYIYQKNEGISDEMNTFYLGNIAPDSIHMRDGATREDKMKTHLSTRNDQNYEIELKKHYLTYLAQRDELEWKWFVKGYFMHLLTDYFWFKELHPLFKESNKNRGLSSDEIRILYYQETDQIDFNIFKEAPWRVGVWKLLEETRSYNIGNLLTEQEILRWRDRTFQFFEDPQKEPHITPKYITDMMVKKFTEDMANRISIILKEWDDSYSNKDNLVSS